MSYLITSYSFSKIFEVWLDWDISKAKQLKCVSSLTDLRSVHCILGVLVGFTMIQFYRRHSR